jgi:hypothetical protein
MHPEQGMIKRANMIFDIKVVEFSGNFGFGPIGII